MAELLKVSAFAMGSAGGAAGWNYLTGVSEQAHGRDPGMSIDKVGHFFGANFDILNKARHIGATVVAPSAAEFDIQRADVLLALGVVSAVFAIRELMAK